MNRYTIGNSRGKAAGRHARRGAALVEAMLLLPVLLTLIFAVVEFGYAFYCKQNLAGAARDGVRAGIAHGAGNTDVTTAVNTALAANLGLKPAQFTLTISPAADNLAPGSLVTVSVSATWGTVGFWTQGPWAFINTSTALTGTAVMQKE